jgi:hypothetical protein
MCGLVGVAGSIDNQDIGAFNDLLLANVVRGKHSTGVAGVDRGNRSHLIKCVGGPLDLQEQKGYDNVVRQDKKVLIGHNRHATVGGVSKVNAHPFDFDNLVGAHNGTVDKFRLKDHNEFPTDSEALYNNMNLFGPEETIKLISGAWALTWYDKGYKTINLIRNKERPLFYTLCDEGKSLWWASEAGMLRWCLERNRIEVSKVYFLEEDMMLTWEVPAYGKPFCEPEATKVEGYKYFPPVVDRRASSAVNWNQRGGSQPGGPPLSLPKGALSTPTNSPGTMRSTTSSEQDGQQSKTSSNVVPLNSSNLLSNKKSSNESESEKDGNLSSGVISTIERGRQEKPSEAEAGNDGQQSTGRALTLSDLKLQEAGRGTKIYKDKHNGRIITKKVFANLTIKGCSWCCRSPDYGEDFYVFGTPSDNEFLCEDCSVDPDVQACAHIH